VSFDINVKNDERFEIQGVGGWEEAREEGA
jgi:hypothetical protein